jgi:hypothetical protein
MLTDDQSTFGIHRCELDLSELYPRDCLLKAFKDRFSIFHQSDLAHKDIFSLENDRLIYKTETFISDRCDGRPSLLLLLGNPASHSVAAGMCFAFEAEKREHRFWKALTESGLLTFREPLQELSAPESKNAFKRQALFDLDYESPFRIGIAVFYSFPSPANKKGWAGVAGLKRLLGAKAFSAITHAEIKRIDRLVSQFLDKTGAILAFQKDAYNAMCSPASPPYSQVLAKSCGLLGTYRSCEQIQLAGAPPTRLIHTKNGILALMMIKEWLLGSTQ